jgi:uncharacterized protein (TIGR02452 family)
VFRTDDGTELESPWKLDFVTAAASVAHRIGQPRSSELMRSRILRVLAIAAAFEHRSLVLGAWGCGAFGNDPLVTPPRISDELLRATSPACSRTSRSR